MAGIEISGDNFNSVKGNIEIENIELDTEFDISRLPGHVCYGSVVLKENKLIDFKHVNQQQFYFKIDSDIFKFNLERNDQTIQGQLDAHQAKLVCLVDLDEQTLEMSFEGRIFGQVQVQKTQDQITLTLNSQPFKFNGQYHLRSGTIKYAAALQDLYSCDGKIILVFLV